jgi:hypothetical protein
VWFSHVGGKEDRKNVWLEPVGLRDLGWFSTLGRSSVLSFLSQKKEEAVVLVVVPDNSLLVKDTPLL